MIRSILIANRGEIARRIIRTCKKLGIRSVAIYSDVDRYALHVQEADDAISIGGYTPLESYLSIEKVLSAAKKANVDAIHPGYGFLSENPDFAQSVRENNLIFIGPSPEAIRLLGDKTEARKLAKKLNIPLLAGSTDAVLSLDEAKKVADATGYPILLKAAAGGGGKGMRIVWNAEELPSAFSAAQREAYAAFGDERVFIEKYLEHPRHIEIQILVDHFGNVLYFPERECSIQRRYQKVIEESPSPAVPPQLRKQLGLAAVKLVQAAKYTNAGTIEFLLDTNHQFAFMEVNTRLQVEHPVTEMLTGMDLVEQQIRIADHQPLSITQEHLQWNGHAIECRICAEDVFNNFFPETGIIRYVREPEGEHIRVDSALFPGYEASIHYDSMMAKLIVWGKDRPEAIQRMLEALAHYLIVGVNTTIPFCHFALNTEAFLSGEYSTRFVELYWKGQPLLEDLHNAMAIAATVRDKHMHQRTASSENIP